MLVTIAKNNFERKISIAGGLKSPSDTELSALFEEAMVFIATKVTPRECLRDRRRDGERILRQLSNGRVVIHPTAPDFGGDVKMHLLFDEDLSYAVVAKAASLYSRDVDDINKFDKETLEWINLFKVNFNKVGS